jgi:hypothetical protein
MQDEYKTQPLRQFQQHPGMLSRVEANSLKMKAVSKNEPPTTILPRLPAHMLEQTWRMPTPKGAQAAVRKKRRWREVDPWSLLLLGEIAIVIIAVIAVLLFR